MEMTAGKIVDKLTGLFLIANDRIFGEMTIGAGYDAC